MSLKKSALAVAVATIIAAPTASQVYAADQSWNGRVHMRLEADEDEDLSLENAGHRIAVQGSGDANNGNKVGYQVELELQSSGDESFSSRDSDPFEVRQAHVTYGGDWGMLAFGRQNNPHNQVYKSDIFERESGVFELAPYRIGDGAVYSGDFGMFGFFAGVMIDDQSSDDGEDIDSTIIGANFNVGKSVAITTSNHSVAEEGTGPAGLGAPPADYSITGIGASWSGGALTVAGYFETEDESEVDVFDLGVWYGFGDTAVGGGYATADSDDETITRIFGGVYHSLGGGADVYGEIGDTSYDEQDDLDQNRVTVGYRVKFN